MKTTTLNRIQTRLTLKVRNIDNIHSLSLLTVISLLWQKIISIQESAILSMYKSFFPKNVLPSELLQMLI